MKKESVELENSEFGMMSTIFFGTLMSLVIQVHTAGSHGNSYIYTCTNSQDFCQIVRILRVAQFVLICTKGLRHWGFDKSYKIIQVRWSEFST